MDNPQLFLQAVERRAEQSADRRLAAGPEGAWCQDLAVVARILKRLLGQVPTLFAPQQDADERERLRQAFVQTKAPFQRLEQALVELARHDRR